MGALNRMLDPVGANVWRRSRYEVARMPAIPAEPIPHDADYHRTDHPLDPALQPSKLLSMLAPDAKVTLDALLVDRAELHEATEWVEAWKGSDGPEAIEARERELFCRERLEYRYAELCRQIVALVTAR